jgi:Fe-S-cluster-containing dehydrogenase component
MAETCGIVADLDLCVGCYACEIACKQENSIPVGTNWIKVLSIGPEQLGKKLEMYFVPFMTDECTLCAHRLQKGLEPRCVENCPTQALSFCETPTELLKALRKKTRHICKLRGAVTAFG